MVLSSLPEAKVLPSGLKATDLTELEYPVRVVTKVGLGQVTTVAMLCKLGILSKEIPF